MVLSGLSRTVALALSSSYRNKASYTQPDIGLTQFWICSVIVVVHIICPIVEFPWRSLVFLTISRISPAARVT
jgi:hypothetical protein